jgi:hypothetical protein
MTLLLAFDVTFVWEILLAATVLKIVFFYVDWQTVADVSEVLNALIFRVMQFEKLGAENGELCAPKS